jgi:hypothetical protein
VWAVPRLLNLTTLPNLVSLTLSRIAAMSRSLDKPYSLLRPNARCNFCVHWFDSCRCIRYIIYFPVYPHRFIWLMMDSSSLSAHIFVCCTDINFYSKCTAYGHESWSQCCVIFITNLLCVMELFSSLNFP